MSKQVKSIEQNPGEKRILCIGGANVDRKIQVLGQVAFGTSNPAVSTKSRGGVARNVAENLGRLGLDTSLFAYFGADSEGDWLLQSTKEFVDINPSKVIKGSTTGFYTAILDADGQMIIALADMAVYNKVEENFVEENVQILRNAEMIVLDMNYPREVIHQIIAISKSSKIPLCIATVSAPKVEKLPESLEGVTWLIANHKEAEALSHMEIQSEGDFFLAAETILKKGAEKVVITRGEKGLIYFTKCGKAGALVAPEVPVVDVTGAGDALTAGILYGYLKGLSTEDACKIGMSCSLVTIQSHETVNSKLNQQTLIHAFQTYFSKGVIIH